MGRRLAILGLSGLLLSAMVAAGLRIHHLEQRVASLETSRPTITAAAVTPVSTPTVDLTWVPNDEGAVTLQTPGANGLVTSPLPNGRQLPSGATPHEINGMTYYVMPLADNTSATARR
jgi:hypothetical protein